MFSTFFLDLYQITYRKYEQIHVFGFVIVMIRFVQLFQESDSIPEDSYCRVEHVVSSQWLHARTGEKHIHIYRYRLFSPNIYRV